MAVQTLAARKGLAEKRALKQRLEGCEAGSTPFLRFPGKEIADNAKAPRTRRSRLGVWSR